MELQGADTATPSFEVIAERPMRVMSLLASGPHLTNVSTAPDP